MTSLRRLLLLYFNYMTTAALAAVSVGVAIWLTRDTKIALAAVVLTFGVLSMAEQIQPSKEDGNEYILLRPATCTVLIMAIIAAVAGGDGPKNEKT